MSNKKRRAAKAQGKTPKAWATLPESPTPNPAAAATALDSKASFNSLEGGTTLAESNSALASLSKVVNMKEEQMKKQKRDAVKAAAKTPSTSAGAKTPKIAKPNRSGLPVLPALPKTRSTRNRPTKPCECGCGGDTKSRFMPGHDSYFRGMALRVERGVMTLDEVERLVGKGQRTAVEMEVERRKVEAKKAARDAKKAGAGKGATDAGAGTGDEVADAPTGTEGANAGDAE